MLRQCGGSYFWGVNVRDVDMEGRRSFGWLCGATMVRLAVCLLLRACLNGGCCGAVLGFKASCLVLCFGLF